jgi:hypothetical protein
MTPAAVLAIYRAVFLVLLWVASFATLVTVQGAHALPLAAGEIAASVALLGRRTQLAGAAVLLLMFAFAFMLSVRHGEWPIHLLMYAASTVFIVWLDISLAREPAPAAAAGSGSTAG